jgi:hypothetical protein
MCISFENNDNNVPHLKEEFPVADLSFHNYRKF